MSSQELKEDVTPGTRTVPDTGVCCVRDDTRSLWRSSVTRALGSLQEDGPYGDYKRVDHMEITRGWTLWGSQEGGPHRDYKKVDPMEITRGWTLRGADLLTVKF